MEYFAGSKFKKYVNTLTRDSLHVNETLVSEIIQENDFNDKSYNSAMSAYVSDIQSLIVNIVTNIANTYYYVIKEIIQNENFYQWTHKHMWHKYIHLYSICYKI